jgi:toxin ParE1/3/4
MSSYKLSFKAREDIKKIYKYTLKNFGRNQAKVYLSIFSNSFHALAQTSIQGRKADIYKVGLRRLEVGSHIVFYFQKKNKVVIVRVLHSNMDIQKHF